MTEQPQVQSIQARIAALNVGHLGRAPGTPSGTNEDSSDRPLFDRRRTANVPPISSQTTLSRNGIGNEPDGPQRDGVLPPPTITRTGQAVSHKPKPPAPPRLPPRDRRSQVSPALPPRRPSGQQLTRRDSTESVSSLGSNVSSISALSNGTARTSRTSASRTPSMDASRMMAPVFDASALPSLPPKRTKQDVEKRYEDIEKSRIPFKNSKSTNSVATIKVSPPPATPSLPPRRPARQESMGASLRSASEQIPQTPARSALSYGMNKVEDQGVTNGPDGRTETLSCQRIDGGPPPIPLSSRPDLSKLQSTKPKPQVISPARSQPIPSGPSCLQCRDFSDADAHAAKFRRESVPSLDWLATQLVAPFTSLTDQARAIFTWLHHNISYDVVAFFNNAVKPSTPASTLSTGLAVCEGYAGLFTAIASKAGLESLVVGGHGKGYGFATLPPGAPVPAEYSTHAWNAVKIDNGEWKLIDCCWGAGNVSGHGKPYNQSFTPSHFTMPNNDFGLCHFPTDKSQFHRTDGRRTIPWDEYILGPPGGEPVRVYAGVASEEGISQTTILPKQLHLPVAASAHPGPTIRFQFQKVCEHWDPCRNGAGKPYPFILMVHGQDGREDDSVVFETSGMFWWADIPPAKLGAPGQTVSLYTVETVSGASGRGMSAEEFRLAKGRKAMGFGGVAAWELV